MGTSRGRYLVKNTAIFTLGNFGTKLINFFMVPLYTHVLTTNQYGTIDLVTTLGMVLAPVLLFNINEGVMRFSLDKNADHNKIASIGLCAFVFAVLVGLLIIPVSHNFDGMRNYGMYIYVYTISYAANLLFFGYLRGKEKLLQYSLGNILNTFLIALLNIVFLVFLKFGLTGYYLAYSLANIISCIYAIIVGNVVDVIRNFTFDKKLAQAMGKYSLVLVPNSFMWWILNSSDRVMITSMIGSAANGVYAVSYKLPSLLSTIVSIFNQAWSYSAIRENNSEDREKYINEIYNGLVMITVIAAVGMMFVIKPFLSIYVEQSYYEAWKYTPFLIIGFVFTSIGAFLASYYTVYKDSKGFLFSASSGALINIVLNFLLIPIIGVYGAALATCVSYIVTFLYRVYDTRKYIKINFFKNTHIIGFLILPLAGATMFIDNAYICEILLFAELLIVVILFSRTWMPMLKMIFNKAVVSKIKK